MRSAQFYTYRNLNGGTAFSSKHHGIVTARIPQYGLIQDGRFQVSDAGRQRCLRTKERNVHAFVVSPTAPQNVFLHQLPPLVELSEVKYNPYKADTFVLADSGLPILSARRIYLIDGRCYVDRH